MFAVEPQVQYCKTSDGVNIAFAVAGSGPPLVHLRTWTGSHVQFDWETPLPGDLLRALAQRWQVVQFDRRGAGLSDRDVGELTLDAFTRDLEAVVDALDLQDVTLLASSFGFMVATIYTLRHPRRVSRIVGQSAFASGRNFWSTPRNSALRAMREADFNTFVETIASLSGNPRHGDIWRASITPEGQKAFVDASETFDVTELLSQLNVPVLLVYRADNPTGVDESADARDIATRVRGARLVALQWEPRDGFTDGVVKAIDMFAGNATSAPTAERPVGSVHTILFTDLVSSTALTQRLGDAKAQELVRAHNAIVREALATYGGKEIKHTGDGIMASFATASGALECSSAIQRAVADRADDNLQVHIGLNAGEPVAEEQDLFGTSVQLARRICDHASSGQILVSNVVRELSAGKDFLFTDAGEVVPRGFDEAVRLYELRWRSGPE